MAHACRKGAGLALGLQDDERHARLVTKGSYRSGQDVEPEEEYILVIDADMIMRAPFLPEELGVSPGWAVSAYFGYLKGVINELALKHVPHVAPRNDTRAGPVGRRGDQVPAPSLRLPGRGQRESQFFKEERGKRDCC